MKRIYMVSALAFLLIAAALLPLQESARAEEEVKYVALTFDDGPWPGTTKKLLDGLSERNVKATFFLIGKQIDGMEALVERMKEEGHQIGNHTYTHSRLDDASLADALRELDQTQEKLEELLGEDTYWIRPPWGFVNDRLKSAVQVPLIHWSVDTEDWKVLDAARVTAEITEQVKSGDIILLHDPYASSVEAALQTIDILSQKGYQFVTLEELFEKMDIEPQPGTFYSRPDKLRLK